MEFRRVLGGLRSQPPDPDAPATTEHTDLREPVEHLHQLALGKPNDLEIHVAPFRWQYRFDVAACGRIGEDRIAEEQGH